MDVEWKRYDRDDKAGTAPPRGQLVWVMELFYGGGTPEIGEWDGYWRMSDGSDDCEVTHWAPMELPAAPAGWPPLEDGD
jgi:hypothetical protein